MTVKYLNNRTRSFVDKDHLDGKFVGTTGQKGYGVVGGRSGQAKGPEVLNQGQGRPGQIKSRPVSLIN